MPLCILKIIFDLRHYCQFSHVRFDWHTAVSLGGKRLYPWACSAPLLCSDTTAIAATAANLLSGAAKDPWGPSSPPAAHQNRALPPKPTIASSAPGESWVGRFLYVCSSMRFFSGDSGGIQYVYVHCFVLRKSINTRKYQVAVQ